MCITSANLFLLTKSRQCNKKLRRSIILIYLLIIFILINNFFNLKTDLLFDEIKPIPPFDKSLFIHINGSQTSLGLVNRIYIINLPRRIDRRRESIGLIELFHFEAFIVPAYSINSLDVLLRNKNRNKFFFKLTELACWASHMRLWITISNSSSDTWSIIFEDDIDLEIDTPFIINSFPLNIWNDADLIYLGHCANPAGKLIFKSSLHIYQIHQAVHPSCTHAYAIKSTIAKKLSQLLSKPSRPIDNLIVKLVQNHQLIVYSIHPPLAIQKSVSNQNPSDVNQINRKSLFYQIQFHIYSFLQWWNGVKFYKKLNKSALKLVNLSHAEYLRKLYENNTWKCFI